MAVKKKPAHRKAKRFITQYRKCGSAAEAAVSAALEWPGTREGFYVYFLIDPRDSRIFYVGKGKGNRIAVHASRGRNGTEPNGAKMLRMQEIFAAGLDVDERVFVDGLAEADAFAIERDLIHALRDTGLTNVAAGIVSEDEAARMAADAMLHRMLPFERWVARLTDDDAAMIARVFGSVRRCYDDFVAHVKYVRDGRLGAV